MTFENSNDRFYHLNSQTSRGRFIAATFILFPFTLVMFGLCDLNIGRYNDIQCMHLEMCSYKTMKNEEEEKIINKRKELLQSCRPRRRHLLPRLYTEQRTAFNNGLNESSVFTRDTSGKVAKGERKRDTTQCNTAKLKQPKPNIGSAHASIHCTSKRCEYVQ